MKDNIELFWAALGALTFAETVTVAETMRDAHDCVDGFDPSDVADWSFLLNSAREIGESTQARMMGHD
jgi:hypothetical protein